MNCASRVSRAFECPPLACARNYYDYRKSYAEEHCAEEHQSRISLRNKNFFSLRFCWNKNIDFISGKNIEILDLSAKGSILKCLWLSSFHCEILELQLPKWEHGHSTIRTSPSFTDFAYYKNIASLGPPNWCYSAYDFTVDAIGRMNKENVSHDQLIVVFKCTQTYAYKPVIHTKVTRWGVKHTLGLLDLQVCFPTVTSK